MVGIPLRRWIGWDCIAGSKSCSHNRTQTYKTYKTYKTLASSWIQSSDYFLRYVRPLWSPAVAPMLHGNASELLQAASQPASQPASKRSSNQICICSKLVGITPAFIALSSPTIDVSIDRFLSRLWRALLVRHATLVSRFQYTEIHRNTQNHEALINIFQVLCATYFSRLSSSYL